MRYDIPGNLDCLQNDITRLQDWSDKCLINFHQDICKVMHIGNHPPANNYTMRQSDNTIQDIRYEMTERDPGVAIDNHLKFKLHLIQTVSQASRLLGMIRRSFEYLDQLRDFPLFIQRLNSTQAGIRTGCLDPVSSGKYLCTRSSPKTGNKTYSRRR